MTRIARRLETESGVVPSWSQVFIAASLDKPYWDKEVREPAVDFLARGRRTVSLATSAEEKIAEQVETGAQNKETGGQRTGGGRKRKGGGAAAKESPQPQNEGGGKKKKGQGKQGKHPRLLKDGKAVTNADGKELCFKYNNKGGCSSPCPQGRLHICQLCFKDHPTWKHEAGNAF